MIRWLNRLLRMRAAVRAAMVGPQRFMEIELDGCMAETVHSIRRGTVLRHARNTGAELRYYPVGEPCILLRYDDRAQDGSADSWQPLIAYLLQNPADSCLFVPLHKDVMEPGVLTRFM